MENFNFYAPTYFAFGKDRENDCGDLVKRFGGSKVLIHFGGGSVVRSGLLDRVKKSLDAANIAWVELGGVKPNPRSGLVYEGIELCKKEGVDFLLAVGGGSAIDVAKGINIIFSYKAYFANEEPPTETDALNKRMERIEELLNECDLTTGDDIIDTEFAFAKIRAGESLFRTKKGGQL